MVEYNHMNSADESTAYALNFASYETQQFHTNLPVRIHKLDAEANDGCHEARLDWIKYCGPAIQFGNCNPVNGNFTSLTMPLVLPDRLRWIGYIYEYLFLEDTDIDQKMNTNATDDYAALSKEHSFADTGHLFSNLAIGRQQIQAKMIHNLTTIDGPCAKRLIDVWKAMLEQTFRGQNQEFNCMEDYLDFRVLDIGAELGEAAMLWGMGITLTEEEDAELIKLRVPWCVVFLLTNDFFSFDREYAEMEEAGLPMLKNAVWLCMKWHGLDVAGAKKMVADETLKHEGQFLNMWKEYEQTHAPVSSKIDAYLRGLAYQLSGNILWSTNCPRYNAAYRYDPNAGLEKSLSFAELAAESHLEQSELDRGSNTRLDQDKISPGSTEDSKVDALQFVNDSAVDLMSPIDGEAVRPATSSSSSSSVGYGTKTVIPAADQAILSPSLIQAPLTYVRSLPAKGFRDKLADALNVWFKLPKDRLNRIKETINLLHAASLMLDDIQDGSGLRRSKAATHKVFGVAQTINSANYAIIEAVKSAIDHEPGAVNVVVDEIQNLHVGQGHDLHWTRHASCPTEAEYLEMVSMKTGGLFILLVRLMAVNQKDGALEEPLKELSKLLGQHFQIHDDYQNLRSATYTVQKGFCEDLDEGKLSFPLIHCLSQQETPVELREILQARKESGALSKELKLHALEQLEKAGSFRYTIQTLRRLQERIASLVGKIEVSTDCTNWVLRLLLQKLDVKDEAHAPQNRVQASSPIMEGWMVREYLQTLGKHES